LTARLDPYIDLVNQRWNEGVTSAETITAELRALGFKGDAQTVRRYLQPFRLPGTSRSRSHPDPRRREPAPAAPAVPKATHDHQGAAHPPRPPDRGRSADREERHRRVRPPRAPPAAAARPLLRQDHGPAARPGTAAWLEASEADDLPDFPSLPDQWRSLL
jgi:hypothetical protein